MRVLIIGKNSYIGNHIDEWLTTKGWKVDQLDVLQSGWDQFDYSSYDSVVHVAGIVHQPDCNDWDLYKRVNTDMPSKIASLAKGQGVRSYVYFSSMAVYGLSKRLKPTIINNSSELNANTMYGKSKLMAEQALSELQDESFNVSFVRPPSVYGKGCKGNYISGFSSVVKKLPVIPIAFQNVKQSMIYIDNLCELVYLIIEKDLNGVFCPQDNMAVSANDILKAIGDGLGKPVKTSRFLGLFVKVFSFVPIVVKAYGGIEYAQSLSDIQGLDYQKVSFEEGMHRTVSI